MFADVDVLHDMLAMLSLTCSAHLLLLSLPLCQSPIKRRDTVANITEVLQVLRGIA